MLPTNGVNPSDPFDNGKRKRRPAGTPDPDAEVVALSPRTLMESDRYVCDICNQGFQRDQNLQMHRRRHKVPWKLLKRDSPITKKRVFVCPDPNCLHHDPTHALGDLVGIKKHFRRKHSNQRQWVCQKCSKGYAVQSDYKAHLKTCGTRGHSCDCGRVFSRVESFIEHQDACSLGRLRPDCHHLPPPSAAACLSGTASSPSPSTDTNFSVAPWGSGAAGRSPPDLELQLLTKESDQSTHLQLSIGSSEISEKTVADNFHRRSPIRREETVEDQLRIAMAEKAYAEEARRQARWQIEVAEKELAKARRIRQAAEAEVEKSRAMKEEAARQMKRAIMEVTCHMCKKKMNMECGESSSSSHDSSFSKLSYISQALTKWGIKKNDQM